MKTKLAFEWRRPTDISNLLCFENDSRALKEAQVIFHIPKPTHFDVPKRPPPPHFGGAQSVLEFNNPEILKCRNDPHPLILGALSRFWSSKTHKFWSAGTTPTPSFWGRLVGFEVRKPHRFWSAGTIPTPSFWGRLIGFEVGRWCTQSKCGSGLSLCEMDERSRKKCNSCGDLEKDRNVRFTCAKCNQTLCFQCAKKH